MLVAQPIVMALISPLAGRLSDRVAAAGRGLDRAWPSRPPGRSSFPSSGPIPASAAITASLVCLGLGFGLFSSPNTNAVMGAVERRHLGLASASLGTMRLTGQMMSAGTVMMIFALFMGRAPIAPSSFPLFLRSARVAFTFFAALCVAGVFASLARGDRPPGAPD